MPVTTLPSIREALDSQPLIDTHEHFIAESHQNAQEIDFFSAWLQHYASSDLVSAGLPFGALREIHDSRRPLEER